jgi:hypothetical protein
MKNLGEGTDPRAEWVRLGEQLEDVSPAALEQLVRFARELLRLRKQANRARPAGRR